jgi:hydrogenase/urease accessory protein HupE
MNVAYNSKLMVTCRHCVLPNKVMHYIRWLAVSILATNTFSLSNPATATVSVLWIKKFMNRNWPIGCISLAIKVAIKVLLLVAAFTSAPLLSAHPLAPALLELTETGDGVVNILWKLPLKTIASSAVVPVFPTHCKKIGIAESTAEATARVTRWQLDCGEAGLVGATLAINNIASSKAVAVLRVITVDGRSYTKILNGDQNQFEVPERQSGGQVFFDYIEFGVEHLLVGWDHLLLVIALTLLVGVNRRLILVVTMFTLGHSVTLSLAAIGQLVYPQTITEIFIALSIVLAIAAVLDAKASSAFVKRAWLIALLFGLLHGLGFAGALNELGLPQEEVPMALLAFNIGIELAQLGLILGLLIIARIWSLTGIPWQGWWRLLPLYGMGGLAAFWFWQRIIQLFTG